jgi:hypothetical protein
MVPDGHAAGDGCLGARSNFEILIRVNSLTKPLKETLLMMARVTSEHALPELARHAPASF